MKPNVPSCAQVFAQRGDPWVSEKEGRERFGRSVQTENPDLDRYTRAKTVEDKRDMPSEKRTDTKASELRKMTNIMMKMHREMRTIKNCR